MVTLRPELLGPRTPLITQAKTWFQAHGYTVGPAFVWDYGKTNSDFRVKPPNEDREVAVISLTIATQEKRSHRLHQWLNIQGKPGVYVITDLGILGLVHSCPDCHQMTRFEFLASLEVSTCPHVVGKGNSAGALVREDLVEFLYDQLSQTPDVRYPGDLDQGLKLVRGNYYEIKPLHFGRRIGLPASQIRSIIELAGGFGAHDKFGGRTEKVWRIPKRSDPEPTAWTFDEEV